MDELGDLDQLIGRSGDQHDPLAANKLVLGVEVGVLRQLDDNVEVQLEFSDLGASLADNGTSDTRWDEDFQEVVTGLRA